MNTLIWTDIPVTNLERAIDFYTAVLARPVSRHIYGGYTFGLISAPDGETIGRLNPAHEHPPADSGPIVYLDVSGRLEAAITAVPLHGGRVLDLRHPIEPWGFAADIEDSEGNHLALHSSTLQ